MPKDWAKIDRDEVEAVAEAMAQAHAGDAPHDASGRFEDAFTLIAGMNALEQFRKAKRVAAKQKVAPSEPPPASDVS